MRGISKLYVSLKAPTFMELSSEIGPIYFTPILEAFPCELAFSGYDVTDSLSLPVKIYEAVDVATLKTVGFAFSSNTRPVLTSSGLLFRYSNKEAAPLLLHKDESFYVYHAVNCYTLITRPYLPPVVEDLIFSI